jgi:hypothetical protein
MRHSKKREYLPKWRYHEFTTEEPEQGVGERSWPTKILSRYEFARSPEEIVLSQRKYVLGLLSGMLGCWAASTSIDQNQKLCAHAEDTVDTERCQKLVRRLLYMFHARLDISYAVSVVSRGMHDPRSEQLEAVYQILRYLKSSLGKGLWFRKMVT